MPSLNGEASETAEPHEIPFRLTGAQPVPAGDLET